MSKRRPPEIIFTRRFAAPPGDPTELEQILLCWGMMLARKALEQLLAERASAPLASEATQ